MKYARKLMLLTLTMVAVAMMSFAAAAQDGEGFFCSEIGVETEGAILVDLLLGLEAGNSQREDGLIPNNIQCRLLLAREAGTPLDGNRAIEDYRAIDGIDVWTANPNVNSDFASYDPPVRVCFDASVYGLDATQAVGPEEMEAGLNGPALMYSDARHINTFKRISDPYFGGSRNFNALNIVQEGIPLGYICADISHPGAINLVPIVPGFAEDDPAHPLFLDTPDRCLTDDNIDDCFD